MNGDFYKSLWKFVKFTLKIGKFWFSEMYSYLKNSTIEYFDFYRSYLGDGNCLVFDY